MSGIGQECQGVGLGGLGAVGILLGAALEFSDLRA